MEANAAPPYGGPGESALSTPPVAAAAAIRATVMPLFSGASALYGIISTIVIRSSTSSVSHAPTTGTGTSTSTMTARTTSGKL